MTTNNRPHESGLDSMPGIRSERDQRSAEELLTRLGAKCDASGQWTLDQYSTPDYFRLNQVASVAGTMFQAGVKVDTVVWAAYRHAQRDRDPVGGQARFDALVASINKSVPEGCSLVPKDSITDLMLDSAMSTSLHDAELESIQRGASLSLNRAVSKDEAAFIVRFLAALRAAPSYGSAEYMSALHSMFTDKD